MRAVVVEIKNSFAAVLSDDGCIITIKNNNYEIGQVIQMNNQKMRLPKKIAMFAASAAAFVMLGTGAWAYASPYTYVSVDVNPSIEFTVNRFDRVLKVKAVNDDGEEILKEITFDELTNESINEALIKTVEQISEAGYFDIDMDGGIIIATSGENMEKAEELAAELQETVEQTVEEIGEIIEVEAISVGLERVEEAKALGVTPGKLNLIEKLQAAASDAGNISTEEWLNKPVKEIMKATKEYRNAAVSGSAIIIDMNDIENATEKAKEAEEKAAEKSKEAAEKAAEKAEKVAEKAKEKAEKEAEKAIEKAKVAKEKAKEGNKEAIKIAEKEAKAAKKAKEDAEKAKEIAEKAAVKAKEQATKAAEKAKEQATKAAEKAKKDAEKASKDSSSNQSNSTAQNNDIEVKEQLDTKKNNNSTNSGDNSNKNTGSSGNSGQKGNKKK